MTRRRSATASGSSSPAANRNRRAAAANPSRPEYATVSPGRAPERSTGGRPSRLPVTVTDSDSTDDRVRSPPTTPVPGANRSHAAAMPSAIASR